MDKAEFRAFEDVNDKRATKLYIVTYHIPGEQHILCSGMYQWQADWLVAKLNEMGDYPESPWKGGKPNEEAVDSPAVAEGQH